MNVREGVNRARERRVRGLGDIVSATSVPTEADQPIDLMGGTPQMPVDMNTFALDNQAPQSAVWTGSLDLATSLDPIAGSLQNTLGPGAAADYLTGGIPGADFIPNTPLPYTPTPAPTSSTWPTWVFVAGGLLGFAILVLAARR
jgi:hypothetical protein